MTSAITIAECERQKRVQADHCERVTRALIDAGPAGMTISLIRCRTAVRSPAEIMARLVKSQKAFSRPDDGGAKGALRWFASAELRDAWKPSEKMVLVSPWSLGTSRWPRFTAPCGSKLVESRTPDPKPAPVRAGSLDFKSCPSVGLNQPPR